MAKIENLMIHKTAQLAKNMPGRSTCCISLMPATIIFDRNLRILNWSEGARDILRFHAKEVIGESLDILFMPEELAYIRAKWNELLQSGKSVPFCCAGIDKFGYFVLREACLSVQDDTGEMSCTLTLYGLDAPGQKKSYPQSQFGDITYH